MVPGAAEVTVEPSFVVRESTQAILQEPVRRPQETDTFPGGALSPESKIYDQEAHVIVTTRGSCSFEEALPCVTIWPIFGNTKGWPLKLSRRVEDT